MVLIRIRTGNFTHTHVNIYTHIHIYTFKENLYLYFHLRFKDLVYHPYNMEIGDNDASKGFTYMVKFEGGYHIYSRVRRYMSCCKQ